MFNSDDFTVIRQIGKGGFGTAHIVVHKATNQRYVLKRVRLARQSAKERQCSVRELHLLANLRHRNILSYIDCWVENGCVVCLLVELCESGDLMTQLRLRTPQSLAFSEELLQEMAVQLLSAIDYLHRSSIVHRDLKSSNVLITGSGCLKLADFGLSTVLEGGCEALTHTMVGTPNYMCPEVLQDKPYGIKNDIWGLGCVLYEMSALKPAFQAFNMAGLVKKITSAPTPVLPNTYSEQWRNLIRSMLAKEPEKRPTAVQLLDCEFLQPAVERVRAKYGPELPPDAPEVLESLQDLPPDIMKLLDQFKAQEQEEKRKADEAKARQKAARAKWAPTMRPDMNPPAKPAPAPVLKPHVPRMPARAATGASPAAARAGGNTPPRAGKAATARRPTATTVLAAAPVRQHRKTDNGVDACAPRRPGMLKAPQAVQGSPLKAEASGPQGNAAAPRPRPSTRPSSAPPDSPTKRSRSGALPSEEPSAAGRDLFENSGEVLSSEDGQQDSHQLSADALVAAVAAAAVGTSGRREVQDDGDGGVSGSDFALLRRPDSRASEAARRPGSRASANSYVATSSISLEQLQLAGVQAEQQAGGSMHATASAQPLQPG